MTRLFALSLFLLSLCAHGQFTPQASHPNVPLISSLLPSQTAPALAASNLACPILNYPNDFDISCLKFDPFNNKFRIMFTMKNTLMMPDYIDVHYQVNGGQVQNHRMDNSGGGIFSHDIDNVPGLVSMNAGDIIQFYFTYSIQGVECDTALFSFTVPAAGAQQTAAGLAAAVTPKQQTAALPQASAALPQAAASANCPMLNYPNDFDISCIKFDPTDNKFRIMFTMKNTLMMPDWIDVHYQVNGNQVQNHRMGMSGSVFSHEITDVPGLVSMNSGDIVQFYFTYSIKSTTCDTVLFSFTVPAAGQQQAVTPAS